MEDSQEFDLQTYWDIIWQRKWLALTVFLAVILSTLYFTLSTPPLYRATSTAMVEAEAGADLFVTSPRRVIWIGEVLLRKHIQLLKSRALAKMVTEELPEEVKQALDNPTSLDIASQIQASITAQSIKETNVIMVSAIGSKPEIAIRLVNAVVFAYQKYNLIQCRADIAAVRRFIEGQMSIVRERMDKVHEKLQRFKKTHKIASLSDEAITLIRKNADLDFMHDQIKIERGEAEEKLSYIDSLIEKEKTGMSSRLENISSPLVLSLKDNLNRLEIERTNLLIQGIAENSPKIRTLDTQIEEIKKKIKEEASNLVVKEGAIDPVSRLKTLFDSAFELRFDIKRLQTREKILEKIKKDYERKLAKFPEEEKILAQLTQESQTVEKIYILLSEKNEQARITEAGRLSEIKIVDLARNASKVQPKPQRNLTLGFFLALLLSGGLCFLLEYLDTSIKTPRDIERFFNIPLLANIPELNGKHKLFLSFKRESRGKNPRILDASSHKEGSEAFRTLRTALQYVSLDKPIKSIIVSSASGGEGKTTVAINLANAMSKSGKKVLLLDLDLRKSIIHSIFDRSRKPGFTDWVIGTVPLKDIIFRTDIENLYCIFSGSTLPNPSDFFDSLAVKKALEDLHKKFEFIVIDSPPILAAADISILAPQVGGIILIIYAHSTDRKAFNSAIKNLETTQAKILGAVLNGIKIQKRYYYYYYYSHSSPSKELKET